MTYINTSQIPLGTKVSDLNPRPKWLDDSGKSRGFSEGELVLYRSMSYNTMTIYRIVEDCPANGNATWGEYKAHKRSTYLSKGWIHPVTGKPIERRLLHGYMVLIPVFNMDDSKSNRAVNKKRVPYNDVWRLKKVDILELGRMFSKLNDFVMSEVSRLKEE
jgi:hypothetical protein